MDKKIPQDEVPASELETTPAPVSNGSEDVQQLSAFMTEYGRPALIGLGVAVIALVGFQMWKGQEASKSEAAVQALFQSRSPEELRQLAATDSSAPTAPIALASAAAEFYALNRYDEALAAYQQFLALFPKHDMTPQCELGVAASHEALDDLDAAAEAYQAFAAAYASHPLAPQAVFSAARCFEQLGRFDEARALYEDFMVANPTSAQLPQAESGLLFLKKAERAKLLTPAPVVVFDSSRDDFVVEEGAAEVSVVEVVAEEVVVPAEVSVPAEDEAPVPAAEEPAAEESVKKKKAASGSKKKAAK